MTIPFTPNRRKFIAGTGSAFAALVASGCSTEATKAARLASVNLAAPVDFDGYGPLVKDPIGMLDLPAGFSYRLLSSLGNPMNDGGTVPDKADGMGCIALPGGKLALIRNHELVPSDDAGGDLAAGYGTALGNVLPGGTTTIVLDAETLAVEREFRSLAGTIRNCSGGITPWGTWLTCEEAPVLPTDPRGKGLTHSHGWVFEVPAAATGLVDAQPLKAMGRFNHEAACVDPRTGVVYLTEDRDDSVFYRFIPAVPGQLDKGGKLQAMVLSDGTADSRNREIPSMAVGAQHAARWVDISDVEAPEDDLREQAAAKGALLIARGEGLHMGEGELYICSTSGGAAGFGQIFRLRPGVAGADDMFELFFESTSADQFNYGDNLTTSPNGHLIVCEDQYGEVVDNYLRGITPEGAAYPLGRLTMQTELAGGCWSPDGKWFFVNAYSPTATVAITGPWAAA